MFRVGVTSCHAGFLAGITQRVSSRHLGQPAFDVHLINLLENRTHIMQLLPNRIVIAKLLGVADPSNVVPSAIALYILPFELVARNALAQIDCLKHGSVAHPAAADIVHFLGPRSSKVGIKTVDEVGGMDVIADLLALVAINLIRSVGRYAAHEISEEAMQLRATSVLTTCANDLGFDLLARSNH